MGKLSEVTRLAVLALTFSPFHTVIAQQGGHTPESPSTSTTPGTTGQVSAPANVPPAPAAQPTRRRRSWRNRSANQAPPANTQPSTPPQSAEELQRQKDAALLKQQQADSLRQQREQEAAVRRRAKQVQEQQNEPRIQDAPGPAETGALPGYPPPPPRNDQDAPRIQDAPGPAQTIP